MKKHNNLNRRRGTLDQGWVTERQFQGLSNYSPYDKLTKIGALYSKFETFEARLAQIYLLLHERFIADRDLAQFWGDAAGDELRHAAILRFCQSRGVTLTCEIDPRTVEHIDALLHIANDIVRDPGVTIEEAFHVSLLIESSELNDIYAQLTRDLAKDHALLYDSIDTELRTHLNHFAEGAQRFRGDKELADAFRVFARSEAPAARERTTS